MGNLIRFEFRKLFQTKVLYICAIVLAAIVLLFAGISKLQEIVTGEALNMNSTDELPPAFASLMGLFVSHSAVNYMLQVLQSEYLIMIFAVFAAVFFCGDYGNNTIRHIFTKGYTRTQVFFSKYLVCLTVSLCFAILCILTGFLFGLAAWGFGSEWSAKVLLLLLLQLLTIAGFNALFCFFAGLFRKVGGTLALGILISILLPMLLSLIDLLLWEGESKISSFWLSGCISLVSYVRTSDSNMIRCAATALLYCALFTAGGWFFHRKCEV